MTILTSLILVVAIILVTTAIAYNVQRGSKTLAQLRANYYDNLQDLVPTTPTIEDIEVNSPESMELNLKAVQEQDSTPQTAKKVIEVALVTEKPKTKNKRKYYPKAPKAKV